MTSLALLTPWPPQQSGIADYAYDLAWVLAEQGRQVTVYTTEQAPVPLQGITIRTVAEDAVPEDLDGFDSIVYQLGNNTGYHLWMIPLLQSHPGVVHLHDLVMHHIAAWLTWLQNDAGGYLELMQKWYGPSGLDAARQSLSAADYLWDSERVTEFPLCEEYLQQAKAVIVHSDFALKHVRSAVPHVPSFALPQYYRLVPDERPRQRIRRISVLGGVDPQKRLDWVIGALSDIGGRLCLDTPVELHVGGKIDERCAHLVAAAETLAVDNLSVIFHGRMSTASFEETLRATDLCIALRYPTMGETSAIVMKVLQSGIPVVVNDIGWYAELPGDLVKKLPVEDCQQALGNLLEYLLNDPAAYREWQGRTLDYARSSLSLEDYGMRYSELCDNPGGIELMTDIFSDVLADCGLTGEPQEDPLLEKILSSSYF